MPRNLTLRDVFSNPLVLLGLEVAFFCALVCALSGCVASQCAGEVVVQPQKPTLSAPQDIDVSARVVVGEARKVGVVVYAGPIEDGSARVLQAALDSLPGDVGAVVLVIDSPGGALHEARAMSRVVEQAPFPVACIADGLAASAGFYLLQACSVRAMTERSQLLIHEAFGSRSGRGGIRELESELESMRSVNEAMAVHQCRRMAMTLAECRGKYAGRDWWLLPPEALAVGAVDVVLPTPMALVSVLANAP